LSTVHQLDIEPAPNARSQRVAAGLRPFQEFAAAGALGGVLLLACAVVALAWANSPWRESYFALWETKVAIGLAPRPITGSLHHWINDGLMAVFFLLVGLEIKREFLVGELASLRQAALPVAAALGGMIVPATIYALINRGGPAAAGWGIPMATDIAFALGVLAMLGRRVPIGLKVFLTALAIVDDLGAVAVIALFYTAGVQWNALMLAGVVMVALVVLNNRGVRALTPYLLFGLVLWAALLASGVHATIAGVLLALTIPSRTRINTAQFSERARSFIEEFDRAETGDLLIITSKGQQEAIHSFRALSEAVQGPLLRLEHSLHGVVTFAIMPLFALANAGVQVGAIAPVLTDPATLGVAAGLLLGKPLGIYGFSRLAVRLGLARLPSEVSWSLLHGAAWLGGIGFTMSLFVAGLAFGAGSLNDAAKVGVLAGSTAAGIVGLLLVRRGIAVPAAARR
jgi:NhaA family Na+:H+ antiporter